MLRIQQDPAIVLETGGSGFVYAAAFHPQDRKHLLGGGDDGIRLVDGEQLGKQTGMAQELRADSISRDDKRIVCRTNKGGGLWDAEVHEKFIDVERGNTMYDSMRFATGTLDNETSIWNITSGERLVGPLEHDDVVTGSIRFSPDGEYIATSRWNGSVRIFDSRNGNQLIDINTITRRAWSNDAQQIFAISTGSQLEAALPILNGSSSLSVAGNNKFIATVARNAILFLDTSTLYPISLDSGRIATRRRDGKIIIHDLANFLPDAYGPFRVSNYPFIMLTCRITVIPSSTLTHCIRH